MSKGMILAGSIVKPAKQKLPCREGSFRCLSGQAALARSQNLTIPDPIYEWRRFAYRYDSLKEKNSQEEE
jgi:hypothetical protein